MPHDSAEARDAAIDLDHDASPDNQLGYVIAGQTGQGFDFQTSMDHAIATGDILMLIDVQSDGFRDGAAAAEVAFGDHPSSLDYPAMDGKIIDGKLQAGPGDTTIRITLGGAQIVEVPLHGSRVHAVQSSTGLTGSIAGGVASEDVNLALIPAYHDAITAVVARDCPGEVATPPCGCTAETVGGTMLGLLDDTPPDCQISLAELRDSSGTQSLIAPDITIDGVDLLSYAISFTAVPATL